MAEAEWLLGDEVQLSQVLVLEESSESLFAALVVQVLLEHKTCKSKKTKVTGHSNFNGTDSNELMNIKKRNHQSFNLP